MAVRGHFLAAAAVMAIFLCVQQAEAVRQRHRRSRAERAIAENPIYREIAEALRTLGQEDLLSGMGVGDGQYLRGGQQGAMGEGGEESTADADDFGLDPSASSVDPEGAALVDRAIVSAHMEPRLRRWRDGMVN
eukprot:TRINITY_DN11293_c0_g1_i1.p1 TRINITY_DN11293_c0_g1~~TRINITY_DN11293_c0_g1_i1.p1  ORF type:complete len:134 (-),score=28.32 TRINITY_DN11293_c0_g1_i1:1079-1480(-)